MNKNRSPKGNMWSAIPVALLCMVVNWNERQGSAPKGTKSCRTQGTFVHSSARSSICPPAFSGLKFALSGLKSTLSGLKSTLSGLNVPALPGLKSAYERTTFKQTHQVDD